MAQHEIRSCEGKTDENCFMIRSVERIKRKQLLWNLSINRERRSRSKKRKGGQILKREARTHKKKKETQAEIDSNKQMTNIQH